jgi:hypothetical protein
MEDASRGKTLTPTIDFSLVEGGGLYRLARACGIPAGESGLIWLGLLLAGITWLPLLALAAAQGVLANGPAVPFAPSVGTHVRLLLAIPLFFVAESVFGPRLPEAIQRIVDAQIIRHRDLPRFTATLDRTAALWHSWVPEAAIMLLTIGAISMGMRTDVPFELPNWREMPDGGRTLAGHWYSAVSLPLFQFLFFRWCWRLLLWGRVLWHLARLDLRLMPTHPDLAGGLGGLGVVHVDLSPLAFACATVLAGTVAEQIRFGGAVLESFALMLSGTVAGITLALVAPLLLFSHRLLEVKQRGLLEYGALAADYTRAFDRKWLGEGKPDTTHLLGSADLQSLADLGSSFDVIGSMRVAPIALRQVLMLAIASAIPLAPLVLFVFPLDELLIRVLKSVVGL